MRLTRALILALALGLIVGLTPTPPATAQTTKPFRLPFDGPPGPATWYLGQPYGNTIGAYRWRSSVYGAGQGLHFGVDFAAPCGTPIVAIGDGVVVKVDESLHGAGPHNLMINHYDVELASFYGHLLERSQLLVGQQVRRGEMVGLSGDPDETCKSRPHLHLEIRDLSHWHAYNPALYIEADWDSLATVGLFSPGFARDLDDPRRWQFMEDQPTVTFGGPLLNDYQHPWPPDWGGY
jgi:murein DD-endopeptidase MepM/ murein hydrolase activator NlpD